MSLRSPSLLRWLRMAVAVLALIGGEGVHALAHGELSAHAVAHEASGKLEIHAGDCQHRADVREAHNHACLFCKGGHAQDVLPLLITTVSTDTATCCRIEAREQQRTPCAGHPGTLGARGPPTTTV
jgi:hypothetical protein